MKTTMAKKIIGVLAGLLLLFLSTTAQAVLSPNLIKYSGFTSATINDNASGYLVSGKWYGSGTGWDLIDDGGNTGAYAKLTEENSVQHLIQAVQVGAPYTSTKGPVQVSLDYKSLGLNPSATSVTLYGSDSQPTYGNYGTGLGTIPETSFLKDMSEWTSVSSSALNWDDAPRGYSWYTVDIYTKTQNNPHEENYFGVDNVNFQLTPIPIPTAVWLLGSGLIGLAILRKRTKT